MSRKFVGESATGPEFIAGGQAAQNHLRDKRSLDASDSYFVTCHKCGHRFTVEFGTSKACAQCTSVTSADIKNGKVYINGKLKR